MAKAQKKKHKKVKMLRPIQPDAAGIDVGATQCCPVKKLQSNSLKILQKISFFS